MYYTNQITVVFSSRSSSIIIIINWLVTMYVVNNPHLDVLESLFAIAYHVADVAT